MVVEDQAAVRAALVKILRRSAAVLVVADVPSAEEAAARLDEARPDLVLLDLELPGMSGLDFLDRVKPGRPDLEVLVLTSFRDEDKVFRAIRAGAAGYLVKGLAAPRLIDAIGEVMAGGAVIDPGLARRFWNLFSSQAPGAPPAAAAVTSLTEADVEVLRYLARGLSTAEVGRVMDLDPRTVRTHLGHLYRALGVDTRVDAVIRGLRLGLVSL